MERGTSRDSALSHVAVGETLMGSQGSSRPRSSKTSVSGCLLGSAGKVKSQETWRLAALEVPIVVCGLLFVFCAFPQGLSQFIDAA